MAAGSVSTSNPNRIIADLAAMCRESLAADGTLDFCLDLAGDLPDIVSDGDRLRRLFLGLIRESIKGMPGSGAIRISTSPRRSGPAISHIEISMEDNGSGLPEGVFWSLYQPPPKESGQTDETSDLALIGQLVRDLGGLINCRSSQKGTRFLVLLPLGKDR